MLKLPASIVGELKFVDTNNWCYFVTQVAGCGQVFNQRAAFIGHVTGSSHQLDQSTYQQAYGSKGETYGQYTCRLCGASIAHKYNNIASHVTLIHDLTLTEYQASGGHRLIEILTPSRTF
jgi:hypothetical protein